jgi:hypothetical protein
MTRGCPLSAVALAVCLALGGCKDPAPPPPAPTAVVPASVPAAAPPPPEEPAWLQTPTRVARPGQAPATLREVRAARNEGFDRVVFQFEGDVLPGYEVEYLDTPATRCGSGAPTEVTGQGDLQIRLQPAQAHDARGQVTLTSRERAFSLPLLQEMKQTCDFEGEVTWVLGVKQPQPYRVLELRSPPRVVVDVRH